MCASQEAQQGTLARACDVLGQFFGCRRLSQCRSLVLSGARPVCLSVCEVTPLLTAFCVSQGNSSIPVSIWDARSVKVPPLPDDLSLNVTPDSTNVPSEAAQTLVHASRPGMRAPLKNVRALMCKHGCVLRERAGQTRDITAV